VREFGDNVVVQAFKVQAFLAKWLAVTRQLAIIEILRV
jgi:hypothetical protein